MNTYHRKKRSPGFLYIFNIISFDNFKDYHDSLPSISFCDLILSMLCNKKIKQQMIKIKHNPTKMIQMFLRLQFINGKIILIMTYLSLDFFSKFTFMGIFFARNFIFNLSHITDCMVVVPPRNRRESIKVPNSHFWPMRPNQTFLWASGDLDIQYMSLVEDFI